MLLLLGVKGVKVKCFVAINQFSIWIFHFSLLVFHFNVPADLQLSCKREQKQISFGYAERSRQSIRLICRN